MRVDLDEAPVWLLRVAPSLAPVVGFSTPSFRTEGPGARGDAPARTVHFAFDEHDTEELAVVAVLLMASVVRGLRQGWEIWEDGVEAKAD